MNRFSVAIRRRRADSARTLIGRRVVKPTKALSSRDLWLQLGRADESIARFEGCFRYAEIINCHFAVALKFTSAVPGPHPGGGRLRHLHAGPRLQPPVRPGGRVRGGVGPRRRLPPLPLPAPEGAPGAPAPPPAAGRRPDGLVRQLVPEGEAEGRRRGRLADVARLQREDGRVAGVRREKGAAAEDDSRLRSMGTFAIIFMYKYC